MAPPVMVDTLRVGGRIRELDEDAEGWRVSRDRVGGEWRESGRSMRLSGGVLTVRDTPVGRSAWVEGSVPKALSGVNYPAVDWEVAAEVGREWVAEAGSVVAFNERPRVNRVDVVRDFEVGSEVLVQAVLLGMAAQPVDGRRTRAVWRDPSERHALSVTVRTKTAGAGRLYDKAGESGLEAAAGVVRFEAQERRGSLKLVGCESLAGLSGIGLDGLSRRRFEWCGFGRRLVPVSTVTAAILGDESLKVSTRLALVGWLSVGNAGMLDAHRSTVWRMRQRLAQYGTATDAVETPMRLDYEEGLVAA